MTSLDEVKSSVPSSAVYVTLVDMLVLDQPAQTSGIEYDGPLMKRTIINAGNDPLNSAYMVHDSRELLFLKGGNTIFSTPLQNIDSLQSLQSLDGYKKFIRGGFVCNLRDGVVSYFLHQ